MTELVDRRIDLIGLSTGVSGILVSCLLWHVSALFLSGLVMAIAIAIASILLTLSFLEMVFSIR